MFLRSISSIPAPRNGYYFEVIQNDSKGEVLEFLNNNFRVDESLNKAARITVQESSACFKDVIERSLQHPISILVRSKKTNEMVGCMLNSKWEKTEDLTEGFSFSSSRASVRGIEQILNKLHTSFWSYKPDISTVLHNEISSVNKNHTRKGIATTLLKWTEGRAESIRAKAIVAEVSSLANQCLMKQNGYEVLSRIQLKDQLDEATGKQLLDCEDGTEEVWLMFKGSS